MPNINGKWGFACLMAGISLTIWSLTVLQGTWTIVVGAVGVLLGILAGGLLAIGR